MVARGVESNRKSSSRSDRSTADQDDLNVVVIVGQAARDAAVIESPDGTVLASFDLVCRIDGVRTVVPVTTEGDCAVTAGSRVAVLGRVNKRFFSSGNGLASRTDVRGEKVVVIRRRDQVSRVIAAAVGILGGG